MGKKKPKKSSSSPSAQPVTEQLRPTRKRGRPRKIVIEEKDPAEAAAADVQEDGSSQKKPRDGTEEPQPPQAQQKGAESSCSASAVAGEALPGRPGEKPRSRGRRKSRPHKST